MEEHIIETVIEQEPTPMIETTEQAALMQMISPVEAVEGIEEDDFTDATATKVSDERINDSIVATTNIQASSQRNSGNGEERKMKIDRLILKARSMGCSDIHITVGMPLMFRINGKLQIINEPLSDPEIEDMLLDMLSPSQKLILDGGDDVDFAICTSDQNRQRVNLFRQDGKLAATIRLLNSYIPSMDMLGLPKVLNELADKPRGLILVTGPTGSGKSTTLASMIDYINSNRSEHIITIEDPVEYRYERKLSLIHQREVGVDVKDFAAALRSALREDPDIILVGEMRDYETISSALTAAETGHLVMSTLHTTGAAQTIDRIIDACPAGIQNQIRTQLASVLNGVITQCLVPNVNGNGRVAATEILVGTDAVGNLIRENKCHQMNSLMQSSANVGMHTLNGDLSRLLRAGMISKDNAIRYSNDVADLLQYL